MKRYRSPKAKPSELKIAYGKEPHDNPDVIFCYGGDGATKYDMRMLMYFFGSIRNDDHNTLLDELENRGYDLTTIKFSIMKKPEQNS